MIERFGIDLRRSLPGLLLAAAAGCGDPLSDPTLVQGPRIVAARVDAFDDPGVAEPGPGQAAVLHWLVLSDEPGSFTARVVWCVAAPTVLGAPRCAGEPFAEQSGSGRFGEPLPFAFSVPGELGATDAWLAWLGVCEAGEPSFDPSTSTFGCTEGEPLRGFYRGFMPEAAPNRNPSLADDTLALDGAAWADAAADAAAPPATGQACLGLGLPELIAGRRSSVTFELGGDDRETLDNASARYAAHPRESLVYTHLASRSGLDRAFSAIDYDAAELGFEVAFDAEPPPAPDGETLQFVLLARDERGGVDWLMRRACVLPP